MNCLVGIGQPLRGDDSAGPFFVEAYPEREGLRKLTVGDDPTRILDAMPGCRRLVLVDAVRSGAPPGTLHRFDLSAPLQARACRFSSHSMNPLEVVELARRLGRPLPERLVLYGVEGACFDLGAGLSEAVSTVLFELQRQVAEELA